MRHDVYHLGGYDPTAPQDNLAASWDLTAGTYTGWNDDGTPAESRPLTPDETAWLQGMDAAQADTVHVADISALTRQAITDNAAYLALPAPTAADQEAQIRRLTRQGQAVARYLSTVVPQPAPLDNLADVTDVTTP